MTLTVNHAKITGAAPNPAVLVDGPAWDASHSVTGTLTAGDYGLGSSAFVTLATGVGTALAINVGTSGSFIVNGGALGTPSSGIATNLTGTASGLTAGAVVANGVSRAMEAQGVARSVIGVTGNATANVADIQGTASQFLGVNSGGTALTFQTMSGDATLSGAAITVTKINSVDQTTAWTTYTPTVTAQTNTITTVSATGRSKTIGKTVVSQMEVTITTAGTGTGYMQVTLPATAASNKYVGIAFEAASTGKSGGAVVIPATSTGAVLCRYADGTSMIGSGNIIAITIVYEIP